MPKARLPTRNYTIEEFLDNANKIAIVKDGTDGWGLIAEELRARDIQTYLASDLDENPDRSIIYGHGKTCFLQTASCEAVKCAGYTNIVPSRIVIPETDDYIGLAELI